VPRRGTPLAQRKGERKERKTFISSCRSFEVLSLSRPWEMGSSAAFVFPFVFRGLEECHARSAELGRRSFVLGRFLKGAFPSSGLCFVLRCAIATLAQQLSPLCMRVVQHGFDADRFWRAVMAALAWESGSYPTPCWFCLLWLSTRSRFARSVK
jgi:hypothetical protein